MPAKWSTPSTASRFSSWCKALSVGVGLCCNWGESGVAHPCIDWTECENDGNLSRAVLLSLYILAELPELDSFRRLLGGAIAAFTHLPMQYCATHYGPDQYVLW